MDNFYIPSHISDIISLIEKEGYECYLVGGYVRDYILGIESQDIDLATNATPNTVNEIFKNKYKVIATGIRYGTITIITEKGSVEVTTFRSEKGYYDSRHPKVVKFNSSIEDDLKRRDFTINALAYSKKTGIIDLFGGIEDLNNRLIRTVGNPFDRFNEDFLRMLRAVRFSSKLNFNIDSYTKNAIKANGYRIMDISVERINIELSKMFLQKYPSKAIMALKECDLLEVLLPEIDIMYEFDQQNPHHKYDLLTHTLICMDNTEPNLILRLAALYHDTGKIKTFFLGDDNIGHFYGHETESANIAKSSLKRLRYPKKIIKRVCDIILLHQIDPINIKSKGIRRIISKLGIEDAKLLAKLQKADSLATNLPKEVSNIFIEKLNMVIEDENAFSLKDLDIDGYDMIKLGLKGKDIGKALDNCFELVIENPNKNNREDLINFVQNHIIKKI